MPVHRYRSIEDMPRPWREPDDPDNLRVVALLMGWHRLLSSSVRPRPGVTRYRSIEEADAHRDDRRSA